MSWDAVFFVVDWNKRSLIKEDFWENCLDDQGNIRPEHETWIKDVTFSYEALEYWDMAEDANNIYEKLRMNMTISLRITVDSLFSRLFAQSFCEYWVSYEVEQEPEGKWLTEVDFSACLCPEEIPRLLSLWTMEVKEALRKELRSNVTVFLNSRFFMDEQYFIWYLEQWMSLLEATCKKPDWGILWSIS